MFSSVYGDVQEVCIKTCEDPAKDPIAFVKFKDKKDFDHFIKLNVSFNIFITSFFQMLPEL